MVQALEKVNIKQQELVSFDIFDTLVTRRVALPTGIFAIMQHVLMQNDNFSPFVKNNFYRLRIECEKLARDHSKRLNNYSEITFDDIYDLMQTNYNLSDKQKVYLKNLEIETEIKNLVPIDKNIEVLKYYLSQGKRVVLISDMYHTSDTIRMILSSIDKVFENIKIYVSSEYKVSKGEGFLYDRVRAEEQVLTGKWMHCGDNRNADINVARKHGIKTKFLQQPLLMPYEKRLLNSQPENLYYQMIIGSARLARFERPEQNAEKYDFGASFAGPILYSYVDYVIEHSLKQGFNTLYFIARDGYIPKIIADIIIENRALNLKTRYLYGSRKAWRIPTEENYDTIISWVFNEYRNRLSYDLLAYRLNMDVEFLKNLIDVEIPYDSVFNKTQRKLIEEKFKNSSNVKKAVIAANKENSILLNKYIRQEVNLNPEHSAFVDLCGSGRSLDVLFSTVGVAGEKYSCFYLVHTAFNEKFNADIISYLPEFEDCHCVELLSKSFEGQTIGYSESNSGEIKPLTELNNGESLKKWGLPSYISGIENFTCKILECTKFNNDTVLFSELVGKYIDYIHDLDKETAEVLGSIPHKLVGDENNSCSITSKISFIKSFIDFILCRKNVSYFGEYPFITAAKSGGLKKQWIRFLQKFPTLQKFLCDVYINKKNKEAIITLLGIRVSFGRLLWRNT